LSKIKVTYSENLKIRSNYLSEKSSILKVPEGKSNSRFLGHMFAKIAMDNIQGHLSMDEYTLKLGPLWIRNLEWVEWDGAIIKKSSKEIYNNYYEPSDIVSLFEFKISGIYGLKSRKEGQKGKTVQEVVSCIKENFSGAQELGAAKDSCFYVSLHERKVKPETSLKENPPIDYYAEAKKIEPEAATCILFNSTSFDKQNPVELDDWSAFLKKIQSSLSH
jgi:hypothetical protein